MEKALFLIMAAKRTGNKRGQALVEFVVMLPVILILIWFLIKVNIAINTSIVGQKHIRSQLFLKMLNHRDGPVSTEYKEHPSNRSAYYFGVSADNVEGVGVEPAPEVRLGVGINPPSMPGARTDPGEASADFLRQDIRIRTAFGICTSRKPNNDGSLGSYCGEVQ